MNTIYMDNASTTKPRQDVIEAMMPYFIDKWYNPSSLYGKSVDIKVDLDNARNDIARFVHAEPNEIYFTSCGSESNCWAIQGFVKNVMKNGHVPVVITSEIEHKSIMSCVDDMERLGVKVVKVPVDKLGFIDLDKLEKHLANIYLNMQECDVLVSMQYANNECGVVQDVSFIADVTHDYGATLHVDAVQAFGQVDIDVNKLGIDMMSVSGHKVGCPKGIGFLYKSGGIDIAPLIYGSQMDGMRGGTENTPYIIGLAKAVETFNVIDVTNIRNRLACGLEEIGCKVVGARKDRLPNNVCVILPSGCGGEEMLYLLDMAGIMCSTGSACNSQSKEPSYVLKAMGLSDDEASRVIRLTVSSETSNEDVDKVVKEIGRCVKLLLSMES